MNILVNYDFNQNQILNVVIQKLAVAPSNPVSGQIYYNTAVNRLFTYNGADWIGADSIGATMTGTNIVDAINLSSSLINDANLSVAARAAISKAHDSHAIADVSGLQTALDGKVDDSQVLTNVPAGAKFTDTTYGVFTSTVNGLVPLSGAGSTKFLRQDGTWVVPTDTNTTYGLFSTSVDGLVPKTTTSNTIDYLRRDGTWATPPNDNTTYGVFTTTTDGLVPKTTTTSTTEYLRKDGTWAIPTNTVYTHPTGAGNNHIPTGGAANQILRWSASGVAVWGADNDTVYTLPVAGVALGGIKSGTDITVDASGNVSVNDDSHSHIISNVDGLQGALDLKETIANVTSKTSTAENNAKAYTDTAVANLLASAPGTLDTLNELAVALGNDPNFATTMTNQLALRTKKFSQAIGGETATVVTHNLNSRDVVVMLRQTGAPYAQVIADVEVTTVNTVTIKFAVAPAASAYTVTIVG